MSDMQRYERQKQELIEELEFRLKPDMKDHQFADVGGYVDVTEACIQQVRDQIAECDLMIAHHEKLDSTSAASR